MSEDEERGDFYRCYSFKNLFLNQWYSSLVYFISAYTKQTMDTLKRPQTEKLFVTPCLTYSISCLFLPYVAFAHPSLLPYFPPHSTFFTYLSFSPHVCFVAFSITALYVFFLSFLHLVIDKNILHKILNLKISLFYLLIYTLIYKQQKIHTFFRNLSYSNEVTTLLYRLLDPFEPAENFDKILVFILFTGVYIHKST